APMRLEALGGVHRRQRLGRQMRSQPCPHRHPERVLGRAEAQVHAAYRTKQTIGRVGSVEGYIYAAGAEDEAFRAELRAWLHDHLTGEFAEAKGLGGPGREHEAFDVRVAWDRHLAAHGWTCLDWPKEYGGRAASLAQQVIFHEEYARADAPIRV